jgi:hypothetical protein
VTPARAGTERLRLSPHASVARLEGEAVVLHLTTGSYFSVNASGATLLDRLASGATRAQLVEGLAAAFGLSPEVAADDVASWLDRLRENDLLVTERDGAEGGPAS